MGKPIISGLLNILTIANNVLGLTRYQSQAFPIDNELLWDTYIEWIGKDRYEEENDENDEKEKRDYSMNITFVALTIIKNIMNKEEESLNSILKVALKTRTPLKRMVQIVSREAILKTGPNESIKKSLRDLIKDSPLIN